MKFIKIIPICADSLGTRSMCLFVETPDIKILIDPNAILSVRYKLPPHPIEYKTLKDCIDSIVNFSKKADYLFISHYHYDHYMPFFEDYTFMYTNSSIAENVYLNKVLFLKDINSAIDSWQQKRGEIFLHKIKKLTDHINYVDGKRFEYGNTVIQFSPPMPHGSIEHRGFVVMMTVMYDIEKFIFASDVYGIPSTETLTYILKESPDWIYLAGPPLYLEGIKIGPIAIKKSKENLSRLATRTNIIIDHQLVRSHNWKTWLQDIRFISESHNNIVLTVAEFLKEDLKLYEVNRDSLWEKYPPDDRFVEWTKLDKSLRKITPPPIIL